MLSTLLCERKQKECDTRTRLTCKQRAAAHVECAHACQPRCQRGRSCLSHMQPCQVKHSLVFARKSEHAAVDLAAGVVASKAVERGGTASQACQKRGSSGGRQRGQQVTALVKHLRVRSSLSASSTAQALATAHLRQVAAQQSRAVRSQRQLLRHSWTWVASEPRAAVDTGHQRRACGSSGEEGGCTDASWTRVRTACVPRAKAATTLFLPPCHVRRHEPLAAALPRPVPSTGCPPARSLRRRRA